MSTLYNYPWHTDACERETQEIERNGEKCFWCKTHGQWAAEMPVEKIEIFVYADGTRIQRNFRTK